MVDQILCGLPLSAVFDTSAVDSCSGGVGVLPVDELMQERAPFLRVGHAPVDEDHVGEWNQWQKASEEEMPWMNTI